MLKIVSFNDNEIIFQDTKENIPLIFEPVVDNSIKGVITGKTWKLDIEAMKPELTLTVMANPKIMSLGEDYRDISLKATLETFKGMKYRFDDSFNFYYKIQIDKFKDYVSKDVESDALYQVEGSYELDINNSKLVTNTKDEPNKIYNVISFDKDKIILEDHKSKIKYILIEDKPDSKETN